MFFFFFLLLCFDIKVDGEHQCKKEKKEKQVVGKHIYLKQYHFCDSFGKRIYSNQ